MPRCQRKYFNHTFEQASFHWYGLVYALFCSPASLDIIPLVAPGILSEFFSTDSYHALTIRLNYRDQIEVITIIINIFKHGTISQYIKYYLQKKRKGKR